MRVLLIAPYYDRQVPGESWSTYKWVQGISERFETTVLTTHKSGWRSEDSPTSAVEVINWLDPRLPEAFARLNRELKPTYLLFYFRARRWLNAQTAAGRHFDLVHQINPLALRYPTPVRGLRIPYVIGPLAGSIPTPHAFAEDGPDPQWYRKLRNIDQLRFKFDPWLRASYRDADLLLAVAPYVKELLASIPVKQFKFISETGVEQVTQKPKAPRRKDETLRLLFVGRIIRTKGVLDAIQAVSMIPTSIDLQFDIIGAGDLMDKCRDLVARNGMEERIHFHGRLPKEQVLQWYEKAHVFLFPSFREPSGNVVLEAMSYGLPIVTTTIGGPGYVVDDSCGIRVSPNTRHQFVDELAKAICKFASSNELHKFAERAIERVEHVGIWTKKIELLSSWYREVVEANRK